MSFGFATASKVVFGRGAVADTLKHAKARSLLPPKPRVMILGGAARAQPLLCTLTADGIPFRVHAVSGEPTTEMTDTATSVARDFDANVVVGFGGGSCIDMGKAVAMLLANGGKALDYMEVIGQGLPIKHPSVPFIAIPTTAGTGAEVTRNAVMLSLKHKQKASLRSDFMYPALAVVDPALTDTVPPLVTACTGMDAFTQCLEPFTSCLANPLTDAIAAKGLHYGARNIRSAFLNGSPASRDGMALCSLMGGLALANSKLGAVHGFAGVLGGVLQGAPHGGICGALLPACIAVNVRALEARDPSSKALLRFKEAACIVTGRDNATVSDLTQWVAETCKILQIPDLSTYGLKPSQYDLVIEKSAKSSSMKGNPIALSSAELKDILVQACSSSLLSARL